MSNCLKMALVNCVFLLSIIGAVMSYHFVPEFNEGARARRAHDEFFARVRRSSGSSASSYSSASASSSSGSGPINFNGGYVPNFGPDGFPNFEEAFSGNLPPGAQIFSRFGEEEGKGVLATGSAQGPKGAFSSTSVTADDTGKVKYSVKSGKF